MDVTKQQRTAHILTCDETSERAQHTASILSQIGFNVVFDPVIDPLNIDSFSNISDESERVKLIKQHVSYSNRISMHTIFNNAIIGSDEWLYVFEDDISAVTDITLDEIIEYEEISDHLFYIGCCQHHKMMKPPFVYQTPHNINGYDVYKVSRTNCLHAVAYKVSNLPYMLEYDYDHTTGDYRKAYLDQIIGTFFIKNHHSNVVRWDEKSPLVQSQRGALYQDRVKFPSQWMVHTRPESINRYR